MIGAVIITHGKLADSLAQAAESITGKAEGIRTLSVTSEDTTEGIRAALSFAIKEVSGGQGVVVFTDMFGGTPTNIALSLLETGKVEVITGVNLPMILKYISYREEKTMQELTLLLKDYGQKAIVLAGDMLKEKK